MSSKISLLLLALPASLASVSAFARLEAHEWGTFTSLVGSDGITQDGMYHEDEALPGFVHGFGELAGPAPAGKGPEAFGLNGGLADGVNGGVTLPPPTPFPRPTPRPCHGKGCFFQDVLATNRITQKMETPVIYFYSDQPTHVDVNVRFPEGVVTESYPGPVRTFPRSQHGLQIRGGESTFSVQVAGPGVRLPIPAVSPSNIYSHARNVDSNYVSTGNEREKFIFYRGLGRFQPRIGIVSQDGNLRLSSTLESRPQAAFLVHVSPSGEGRMLPLTEFVQAGNQTVSSARINALQRETGEALANGFLTGVQAQTSLVGSLSQAGLTRQEAQAMVDTWAHGYLRVPGLRLLYILPRSEVDQVLPLQLTPAPERLERAFVGRMEILLDTEEKSILKAVLAQGDAFEVGSLGRFAEPMLRRVREVYALRPQTSSDTKSLLDRLVVRAANGLDHSASTH